MTAQRTSISRERGVALALELLRRINARQRPPDALAQALGISRASLYRLRAQIERDYGVRVEVSAAGWAVAGWGVLDRRRVCRRRNK